MLSFRRVACDPRTGARCAIDDYVHPSFRLRVVDTDGVTWDEELSTPVDAAWKGDGARAHVLVPLAGLVHLEDGAGAHTLGEGHVATGTLGDTLARIEPGARVIMLDYAIGTLGTRSPEDARAGVLDRRATAELLAVVAELREGADPAATLARLLVVLRGEGLPVEAFAAGELSASATPEEHAVAVALTAALSRLDASPMMVDLERRLGRSRRHVVDLVARFCAKFDLDAKDWRTLHRRWRVMAGSALMTHREARTEDVARAVGYGSARAFCHAFAEAGLPSPGNLRRAVAA